MENSLGSDYDDLPYLSLPAALMKPARMAALAALHGLHAPPADRAHVLELGCAAGGNLIPLAARFPAARFVGIDISQRQIEMARSKTAELDLANATFVQADITDLKLAAEPFDYVICHGVFSWVPAAVQDAILRICADHLSPNGMAVISYNVLPGWRLRNAVRDILRYHAEGATSPSNRVAKARAALEDLAARAGSRETDLYGKLLRQEARRLAKQPDSYIFGEYLVAENTPFLFSDFVKLATEHGLGFLCEAGLYGAMPEKVRREQIDRTAALPEREQLHIEQQSDLLTGLTFRRSVLIKAQRLAGKTPPLQMAELASLHLTSPVQYDNALSSDGHAVFANGTGQNVSTDNPWIESALRTFADSYPGSATVDQLAAAANQNTHTEAPENRDLLSRILIGMIARGLATASTQPLRPGGASDRNPKVWRLARAEAATGQPWVTNLAHVATPLPSDSAAIIKLFDGTRDVETILTELNQARAADTEPITATHVQRLLDFLHANALLE